MSSQQSEIQTIHLSAPATVAQAQQAILRARAGDRLLFILPEDAANFAYLPRLKALRREADDASVQIGLVTGDGDIKYFAKQARIPVYKTADAARKRWRWPKPEGTLPPPHKMRPTVVPPPPDAAVALNPPTIVTRPDGTVLLGEARTRSDRSWLQGLGYVFFIGLIALAIVGLTLYLLPQATVYLTPARSQVISSVELTARTGIDEPDPLNNLVPARVVQARVEGFGTTPTTGQDEAPVGKATGVVTFVNRTSRDITVPEGTIVRTSFGQNVRFKTLHPVNVPAGVGQKADVDIEALEPGPEGNVPALTINKMEGGLGISLRVSNSFPTSGGTEEVVSTVTQADKDRLLNELMEDLQKQAYEKLAENLRQGEYIPPQSVQTYVLAATYDRFAGEHADELGLQLQLLTRGMAVDMDGARDLAERSLREKVPDDKFLLEETIRTGEPHFTLFGDDFVEFSLTASGEVIDPISAGDVRAVLTGAPADRAVQLLEENFDLAEPPVVKLVPGWIDHLPTLPFRIIVRVYKDQDTELILPTPTATVAP